MSKRKKLKARDHVTLKSTRDGLMEHNATTGEDVRVGKKDADFELGSKKTDQETYSQIGNRSAQKNKRRQRYNRSQTDAAPDSRSPQNETRDVELLPDASPDPASDFDIAHDEVSSSETPFVVDSHPTADLNNGQNKSSAAKSRQKQQVRDHHANKQNTKKGTDKAPEAHISTADKPTKLQFSPDEAAPTALKPISNRKLDKAQVRAEKTSIKLEKAKGKLPQKHKPSVAHVLDEKSGTAKRKLHFETKVKSQAEHLKGPMPLRPVKIAGNSAMAFGHRKIYQVQDENVGIEAAHKGEMMVEGGVRVALRHHKTAPYRKVAKLEHKTAKKSVNLSYQKVMAENPKLKSNLVSRAWQKRKLKKDYAKAARESQKAAKKAGETSARAARAIAGVVKRHPIATAAVVLTALLMFVMISFIGSFGSAGSGGLGAILSASYLAEDLDIENAELAYTEWQTDLQLQIAAAETTHTGYDEYRYNIADISHNPYELMAYLTVKHQNFSYAAIEAELRTLFSEQYDLSFVLSTETRYADPNDSNNDGDYEPYDWKVLTVTLTARSFSDVVFTRMSGEEYAHFALLLQTKGSRQILANPFDIGWLSFVTSDYGYRIHPISGAKNLHRGVDIGLPTGTEIHAGQDGTVTFAGWSDSYGNYVVIEDDKGLSSKYAHCNTLLVTTGQTVSVGDVIATVGNTGNSTGPHLHLEILKDGQYLNPLYFCDTGTFDLTPSFGYAGAAMGDGTFAAMMEEALKYQGYPYVYGGSSPSTSFDCSGMVCWVINQSGAGSVGRTTANGLYNICTPVSPSEAQPGDLTFFHSTYSHYEHITHVAIYCGGNQMYHAGNPIGYASIDTAYWQQHFFAFGRLPN